MLRHSALIDRAPMPPPLPPGTVESVPERGEMFVRRADGPAGSPPVVLLHGWTVTADLNFFPVFAALAQRGTVIAPDLRGHGRSLIPEKGFSIEDAADDVAALLAVDGAPPAIVVGYSLGASVAQAVADRHPDRVAAVVLAAGEFAPARRLHKKLLLRMGGWHSASLRRTTGRWLAHRLTDIVRRDNPAVEAIRPWLVAELERGHPGALKAAGRALGRFDAAVIAARCAVPAVVLMTTRDRLVPPRIQQRLADAWGADIVQLEADHDAPVRRPVQFAEAIVASVERAEALAAARSGVPRLSGAAAG